MIALQAVDLLGVYVEPAVICLLAALAATAGLQWALNRIGINRFVYNRALFDLAILIATTSLLVLLLRIPGR
ncbi:DUF1656 domain-containing protein [Methylobacterium nonmethylotrophicum]|uniref:DUF1656 domain-containing protein n=1 Tax=Methylobacterium nonmethylotrophicum TaxID=1141884 RepID=A0A4Z0NRW9_9HYPH|nr:DUF1656 domain-containing protein [Methylobacterium nonmethylotrophicum]TGD99660.1 DUF1656 domain-containing protein [Methylobacterium nonmethylotrophicum]